MLRCSPIIRANTMKQQNRMKYLLMLLLLLFLLLLLCCRCGDRGRRRRSLLLFVMFCFTFLVQIFIFLFDTQVHAVHEQSQAHVQTVPDWNIPAINVGRDSTIMRTSNQTRRSTTTTTQRLYWLINNMRFIPIHVHHTHTHTHTGMTIT